MKDIIAALIMLGSLVGAWYWIANKFRQKGTGAITRHFAGMVCGVGALFIAGIVVAAMGLLDSESSNETPQTAGAEQSTQAEPSVKDPTEIEASKAEAVASQPNSEEAPASEAVEDVALENTSEASGNSIADRRDEIQAGSDIGVDVETFTKRFNDAMAVFDLPFRSRGEIPALGDEHVQRSVSENYNDNLAMLVTVKPYTDDIRDLMFIGSGDGTLQSGANVMMTASGVFSATQESWPPRDVLNMLLQMTEEYRQQAGDSEVTRILNGLEYSYSQNDLFGNMFSVSAID